MQCPGCNHPISDTCTKCVYCGTPTGGGEGVVCDGGPEVVTEKTRAATASGEAERHPTDALSLEKTVAVLAKMKDLLDCGRFEADVYERMSLDIIKDFLSTMNDSVKLIFVSYEIQDSTLAPFLTEDMIGKLKTFVMDSIAQR